MLNVLGENYYIDLDEVEKYLDMSDQTDEELDLVSGSTEMRINVIKFELVKLLLDTILSEQEPLEDKLGLNSNKNNTSVPFKLAFNTLLNKKLINHY
jgi:hypothetical protein